MEGKYNSVPDTEKHAERVRVLMLAPMNDLSERSAKHDQSKMNPPEVEMFDKFTPKLKNSTYGSDEYKGFLKEMGEALKHHYEANRHHPEHFPNGINDMNLVDLIEMLCDWKAATERHANGSLEKSFEIQTERFGISPQLLQILKNTAKKYLE